MNKRICDYCGEPWPKNNILLTHRPNDTTTIAELCEQCLIDIAVFAEEHRHEH